MNTGDNQYLFAEYQAGHSHLASVHLVMWQFTALVFGAAIAGAAALIPTTPTRAEGLAYLILSSAVVVVLLIWLNMWNRHQTSLEITFRRLREIERDTNMKRNIYLDLVRRWALRGELTNWTALTEQERETLETYPRFSRLSGGASVKLLAFLIAAGWLALGLWKLTVGFGWF